MRIASSSRRFIGVFLLTLVTALGVLSAQDVTERKGTMGLVEGRKYVVAFPQVWAGASEEPLPNPMLLFISSKVKTTVRVRTSAAQNDIGTKIDKTYTVNPNQVIKVPIPRAFMMPSSDGNESTTSHVIKGYGLEVTAGRPISVSTYQSWTGNGELARHLPVEAWGKLYSTMNFYNDRYGKTEFRYRPGQIIVIADKDNTVVNFTPTWETEGGPDYPSVPAGKTGTIELMKGQVFIIKGKIDEPLTKEFTTDLSGTVIRASKPVGVVSGHTKVAIMRFPDQLPPTGFGGVEAHFVRNNVHDAMLPTEMAGTEFVTIPSMYTPRRTVGNLNGQGGAIGIDDDKGDVIRFNSLEDGTLLSEIRADGSLKNYRTLRKGESFIIATQETAAAWRTSKPALCGLYGKSWANVIPPVAIGKDRDGKNGETPQGHPTVEAGMPMLEYVPSTDRWVNYGVFYAPEGMDNFFNIAFRMVDVSKIKVDGRALASIAGGSLRPIAGTPYAQIRMPIGAGDHVVESISENVRWAAWNYGSLDGMAMGRAYGTPVAIDLAIPCDDSLSVVEQIICGNVKGVGKILPENTTCGSIFAVYAEELTNYVLVEDENFNSGDKVVNFQVNVIDPTKDARGIIRVVSRSGKYVEKEYTYTADKLAWDPASIDFGVAPVDAKTCRTITFTNKSADRPLNVRQLIAKRFPTTFSFEPSTFMLGPGESKVVNVCALITTTEQKIDTVIAKLECYDQVTTELKIRGDEPSIYVYDQNWGRLPIASSLEKAVVIENRGQVDLVVTGYDKAAVANYKNAQGQYFSGIRNLDEVLPLTIKKGEKHTFFVTYMPQGEANAHRLDVLFYSSAKKIKSNSVWVGEGVVANLIVVAPSFDERVIDTWQVGKGINNYTLPATLKNEGNKSVMIKRIAIEGADAKYFTLGPTLMSQGGNVPDEIQANATPYSFNVIFTPTEVAATRDAERMYDYSIVVYSESSGVEKNEAQSDAKGTARQPHVVATGYDWTRDAQGNPVIYTVGDKATGVVTITNQHPSLSNALTSDTKGSMKLTITSIAIDQSNPKAVHFSIDPSWTNAPSMTNPIELVGGEALQVPVIFDPKAAGLHECPYIVGDDAPENPTPLLRGEADIKGSITAQDQSFEQFVFNSIEKDVRVTNGFAAAIRINIGALEGPDNLKYEIVSPSTSYIDVPANGTAVLRVRFTPDFVSKKSAGQNLNGRLLDRTGSPFLASIPFSVEGTPEITDTAYLTGEGIYLETTDFVGRGHQVNVGASVNVPVELKAAPQGIDVGAVRQFRIRISYDKSILKARPTMITDGTLTQGWTVTGTPTEGFFELDFTAGPGAPALMPDAVKPLFTIVFDAFLGKVQESVITPEMYIAIAPDQDGNNKKFVVFNNEPGKVTVILDCAKQLRIVDVGTTTYSVGPISPNPVSGTTVISYSIGLNAQTMIVLYNSSGTKVMDIIDQPQAAGSYELSIDVSTLPAGVYYYQVVSGPFTSEPQKLLIVR